MARQSPCAVLIEYNEAGGVVIPFLGSLLASIAPAVIGGIVGHHGSSGTSAGSGAGSMATGLSGGTSSTTNKVLAILKAAAPNAAGAIAEHYLTKSNGSTEANGSGSSRGTGVGSAATQTELERLALDRVRAAQPLYEAVLNMAGSRMPNAYRPGGSSRSSATVPGIPNPQNVTVPGPGGDASPDTKVPDYAQQIVDSYRGREAGGWVTLMDPETGETRTVDTQEAAVLRAQGWVPATGGAA